MKKIVLVAAVVVAFTNLAFAEFGIFGNIRGSGNSSNFKDFASAPAPTLVGPSQKFSKQSPEEHGMTPGFGVFYEHSKLFGMSEKSYIGVNVSYNGIGEDRLGYSIEDSVYSIQHAQVTSNGYQIPITVYYKYKTSPKFALKAGAGVTYVFSKWELEYIESHIAGSASKTETILAPHVDLGIEWILGKVVTLGFDLSYALGGKSNNPYILLGYESVKLNRDFSGLYAGANLRFYIL
ncbi:outer membrane beta-barrel protein [Endomicrobium proavitum]|uniref:Putative Outer membrane protein n=1 Tax=Endomicrobium proavitum TaxID=1408281 RepID=A0A0G3WGH9_9BACT|nr:outer membrane beta-barrel protein [Endomicrobium proavitum]AKL97786.1 putative Outer membrane protein [Endomicrobium proavitum]